MVDVIAAKLYSNSDRNSIRCGQKCCRAEDNIDTLTHPRSHTERGRTMSQHLTDMLHNVTAKAT